LVAAALAIGVSSVPAFANKPTAVTRSTQLLLGTVVDPLDALASLRDSDPRAQPVTLFTVQVDKTWSGYMSLAALDNYDGDIWTFSATFRPTGGRVPSAATSVSGEAANQLVSQRYTLERSIGLPFLPVLDRAVQVQGRWTLTPSAGCSRPPRRCLLPTRSCPLSLRALSATSRPPTRLLSARMSQVE
jgi:hypothetical protein